MLFYVLWAVGMHWNYSVDYFPSSDNQNITMTAIGKETVTDAFGAERDSFLVRMTGSNYEDEEKSYRWVDTSNLLYLHTYWEDDPDSSSYFQEGYLGWNFTDENGIESDLLSATDDLNLHFNRTNLMEYNGITKKSKKEFEYISGTNPGTLSYWVQWYNHT